MAKDYEELKTLSDNELQSMYWMMPMDTDDEVAKFRAVEAELDVRSIGIVKLGQFPDRTT